MEKGSRELDCGDTPENETPVLDGVGRFWGP